MKLLLKIVPIALLLFLTACVTYYPKTVKRNNGNHYGWYKNPRNPHNPNSYKPKPKGKGHHPGSPKKYVRK
ncbi:MAG: hypothetical protein V4613_06620 [Bacteroidota bacterium]